MGEPQIAPLRLLLALAGLSQRFRPPMCRSGRNRPLRLCRANMGAAASRFRQWCLCVPSRRHGPCRAGREIPGVSADSRGAASSRCRIPRCRDVGSHRLGYLVVAPTGPGLWRGRSDAPELGLLTPSFYSRIAAARTRISTCRMARRARQVDYDRLHDRAEIPVPDMRIVESASRAGGLAVAPAYRGRNRARR